MSRVRGTWHLRARPWAGGDGSAGWEAHWVGGLPVKCGCGSRVLPFLTHGPWSLLWASYPSAVWTAWFSAGWGTVFSAWGGRAPHEDVRRVNVSVLLAAAMALASLPGRRVCLRPLLQIALPGLGRAAARPHGSRPKHQAGERRPTLLCRVYCYCH